MQTSLARRQRHRRLEPARRPRGGAAIRRAALILPLLLFSLLILAGAVVALGAVTAYAYYSRGLDDPRVLLSNLSFDQQTVIWDRTGKIELARLGDLRRELVTFNELPPDLLDATTATEDKDFWKNPGFDLPGFISASVDTLNGRPRGASTITQQLVRARLLPEEAFADSVYERKIREIIQSVRLTQEYPGVEGKRDIMTAYLNQNFYGDRSYGVKAAALTYFGLPLEKLSLAQSAVLAAIPQSPTRFDLTQNAQSICSVPVAEGADCPAGKLQLIVPDTTEIYARRNYVLDRMRQFPVLSHHTDAEYAAAMAEPIVLVPQVSTPWKAPHLVWQVRDQLAGILCPGESVDKCEQVDTGGYHVTTTLDYRMQRITERWIYASTQGANAKEPRTVLRGLKIPTADWGWILKLRGHKVYNGAAAIIDYRTGEVLAYAGSASYTSKGTKKFQPQFDVLSDGWRQPGSAIKPLNYVIGIDDKTMTASTMFMDVVTNFGGRYTPTQADGLERGPVRLRSALQFSLNIPAIKAGIMNGLDHFYTRAKDFGIHWVPRSVPVTSMSIGTIEVHPIDLTGAYGAIANAGKLMPRTTILKITRADGTVVWPDAATKKPKAKIVISPQAAYILTDILAGNTVLKTNPFWGEWAVYDKGVRRPAAYKTGTTNDNRDVHAYGYLAPPKDPKAPALVVGVWMGNSNNEPDRDTLSLGSSAPLWSRILTDVSRGTPIATFKQPKGIVTASVDAISGMKPGPFTKKTVKELFIAGTAPTQRDDLRRTVDIDMASGLRWREGCVGPRRTVGALDFSQVEANHANWQKYDNSWARRAARGAGVGGGPKGTRTSYLYGSGFFPFGRTWGGIFDQATLCPFAPPPTEPPCTNPFGIGCPPPSGEPPPSHGGGGKTPKP